MLSEKSGLRLETWLVIAFVASVVLATTLIVYSSAGKETVFSPYVIDAEGQLQYQQLDLMAEDLGEDGMGYTIANVMSTPMLVNDWKEPHRTMLLVVAPEKPFDAAEADAMYDFVTEKGGKVIIASNSINAQRVAEKFGVVYLGDSILDPTRYYEVTDNQDQLLPADMKRVWALGSINKNASNFADQPSIPCEPNPLTGILEANIDDCRAPILFHSPSTLQVLGKGEGADEDIDREVLVLAHSSADAVVGKYDDSIANLNNPTLGPGMNGLIVRIDYPGIKTLDNVQGDRQGEVEVTGSIVFISDHSVFANHLWDIDVAEETNKQQCDSEHYRGHQCWDSDLSSQSGSSIWYGNSLYFESLINDMMEHDNEDISATITRSSDEFNIVFDESRHVISPLASPFTEAMSAMVMLTSDVWLKWLIVLNLFALLSIAIMVVPEKENWRHVFDLTRFRERPKKLDPAEYKQRVRESLMNKVRQFHDLTRDEMAMKTPAEVQTMIRDPRLIELAYSQQRVYSNDELMQIMQQIRRWGK